MTDITKFNRNGAIRNIGDAKVRNALASSFSTGVSYSTNDYCMYDGELYRFIDDHTAGSWNSNHVELSKVTNDFVRKTGDTINDFLCIQGSSPNSYLKSTKADSTTSSIESSAWIMRGVLDKNDKFLTWDQSEQHTDGKTLRTIGARHYNSNGNPIDNYLAIGIDSNCSPSINISNPKAWHSALNTILYFTDQPVSVASNAQIMRIPASGTTTKITTDTIALSCLFNNPNYITSEVLWHSYDGYITFTGTCIYSTTCNIILGRKSN